MAALRFSLLVAVLLGLVLLTAPDQASADTATFELCVADRIWCSRRGLRCAECSDHCTKASQTNNSPGLAARAKTWAWICTYFGRK